MGSVSLSPRKRNAARDRRNGRQLRRLGWSVLTVWECQTRATELEKLQRRIGRFLSGR